MSTRYTVVPANPGFYELGICFRAERPPTLDDLEMSAIVAWHVKSEPGGYRYAYPVTVGGKKSDDPQWKPAVLTPDGQVEQDEEAHKTVADWVGHLAAERWPQWKEYFDKKTAKDAALMPPSLPRPPLETVSG